MWALQSAMALGGRGGSGARGGRPSGPSATDVSIRGWWGWCVGHDNRQMQASHHEFWTWQGGRRLRDSNFPKCDKDKSKGGRRLGGTLLAEVCVDLV